MHTAFRSGRIRHLRILLHIVADTRNSNVHIHHVPPHFPHPRCMGCMAHCRVSDELHLRGAIELAMVGLWATLCDCYYCESCEGGEEWDWESGWDGDTEERCCGDKYHHGGI